MHLCLLSFCCGAGHGDQIAHVITEEIFRPVNDVAEQVNLEGFQPRFGTSGVSKISGDLVVGDETVRMIFSNAALEAVEEVFGVCFNNELDVAWASVSPGRENVNEKVGKIRLCFGVQMQFRLLDEENRTGGCIKTLHQNRQDL